MINVLILFDKIFNYFGCISGCLGLCSADDEGTKSTDRGVLITAGSIRSTYTENTYIRITCIMSTWIRCFGVESAYTKAIYTREVSIGGVKPRIWARLGIIWYIKGIELIWVGLGIIIS